MRLFRKLSSLFIVFISFLNVGFSQNIYQKFYSYENGGQADVYDMERTSNNNYIITGRIGLASGAWQSFLMEVDQQGDTLWCKNYSGGVEDIFYSVVEAESQGGYALTGRTQSYAHYTVRHDLFLVRLNNYGDTLWSKTLGKSTGISGYESGLGIDEVSSDNGFVVCGYWNNKDAFLVRTDSLGDTLWTKKFDGDSTELFNSVKETHDNNFVIVGTTNSFGAGKEDVLVMKTDLNGNRVFTRTYGGSGIDKGKFIYQLPDKGFIIGAESNSFGNTGMDYLLFKIDSLGNILWQKTYSGSSNERLNDLLPTSDGGYILAGETESYELMYGDTGNSYYYAKGLVVKTGSAGQLEWARSYTDTSTSGDKSIGAIDPADGGYMIAGNSGFNFSEAIHLTKTNTNGQASCLDSLVVPADSNVALITSNPGSSLRVSSGSGFLPAPTDYYAYSYDDNGFFCDTCLNPIADFNYSINNLTVNFTDNSIGASEWSWSFGDSTRNPTHSFPGSGSYTICLIVINSCGSDTVCKSIVLSPFGMNEFTEGEYIVVQPNPAKNKVNLVCKQSALHHNDDLLFTIVDVFGRTIEEISIQGDRTSLPLTKYDSGIYFYVLINGREVLQTGKIIVTK